MVAFLKADGTLSSFRFANVPIHLEGPHLDLNHDELYQVALGDLNFEGTSFSVKVTMSLGKSGEFLVEQGIIQTYLSKKYYTEWIKPPNPEEDKKEEEVKEVVQYLKGKYQVKFSGQQIIKSGHNTYFFEFKTNDQNRAIHGSEVLFQVKKSEQPAQGNK